MLALLTVQGLSVSYVASGRRPLGALAKVSFTLEPGETLGILGESGSGKSTLAVALLRMLPANGKVLQGAVRFAGKDLLRCDEREMQSVRGAGIALIFQEPSLALHPALRVRRQVADVIAAHQQISRSAVREKTRRILSVIFLEDAERIGDSYPHQLSGGQRARVLIAQAISCEPALIIADEPTAALDGETQRGMLDIFSRLRREFNLSLIWITHNPALLEGFADRVMVLYAGRIVEMGPAEQVLQAPQHPYTRALLRARPPELEVSREGKSERKGLLRAIPGELPAGVLELAGCAFEARCEERLDVCGQREPVAVQVGGGLRGDSSAEEMHEAACFKCGVGAER
jgi:oligopeptide/dipeptide ABC transporter ATP-binding protein